MERFNDYLDRCTRVAVFGGTFDPIHNGHLAIAEAVLHQFKPQKVLFMPAGSPPHKPNKPITEAEHRYQMILQTISKTLGLDVSRFEIDRVGSSYTIDTIKALKATCPSNATIYFILGYDMLLDIPNWRNSKELLNLCEFITVARPGYEADLKQFKKTHNAKVHLLESPLLEISSTYIRESIKQDRPVSALMPIEALNYAKLNGLYDFIVPDLSKAHFDWANNRLKIHLSPRRYKHSMGVVIEAEKLAKHYGADTNKARWAALLHDTTKEYGANKKRALCKRWNIETDKIIDAHIELAHGLLGAESAKYDYFVTDKEILQAIGFHILGHKNMTLLDKIILLADFIEPYRDDYYPLKEMREYAYVDINKALIIGLTAMRDIDASRGKTLHPWSEDALKTLSEI